MTTLNKQAILGSIVLSKFDGVSLVFTNEGGVLDHATMRAAQLTALTTVMTESDGFTKFNDEIRNNLLWLVETLSKEVADLIPLVSQEAEQHAKAKLVGDTTE